MVRALGRDGWECHVVFPDESPLAEAFCAAGAGVHVIPMRRLTTSGGAGYYPAYLLLWPASVARLAKLARQLEVDVVHSNSLHSWYGWAVAALVRRPHLWHAREIVVQSRAALRVERLLTRRFATKVLCVSQPVASQLPGSPTVVVHDWVDDAEGFSPLRAGEFRAEVGIGDNDSLVGAAGRIDTWKGFDLLLSAVDGLRAGRPDVHVVVAGGPVAGKQSYAETLAERANHLPGVHWLGPRQDMPELLADLDVFVLPSTEPEPFSAVALEALASGVPVAASAHGGSPEMLNALPPSSAALFAPRDAASLVDAVLSLLPSAGASSTEGRRGRRRYLVGDPDEVAKIFDEVIRPAGVITPPTS